MRAGFDDMVPPFALGPLFRSVGDRLEVVPGSSEALPEKCKYCPGHDCVHSSGMDKLQVCRWGYGFVRLTENLTAFGILTSKALNGEPEISRRLRKKAYEERVPLPDQAHVEAALSTLRQYLQHRAGEVGAAIEDEIVRRREELTATDILGELKSQFDRNNAVNHDYVKIAAGIRANMARLKKDVKGLADRREAIAIEGAALRLQELPSLHLLLQDPSLAREFPDRDWQRVYATVDSYWHYLRIFADELGVSLPRPTCRQGTSEAKVFASRRVLGGIVLQLLDNAITYSPPGGAVSVAVDDEPGTDAVSIVVESVGPRIRDDEIQKIFQPFFRGEEARKSRRDGGGVGLAIVKTAAEALDGSVEVTQTPCPDGGYLTTFRVLLPSRGR